MFQSSYIDFVVFERTELHWKDKNVNKTFRLFHAETKKGATVILL